MYSYTLKFRTVFFAKVLDMQRNDSNASAPTPSEAHHLFSIWDSAEVESVIQEIVKIAQG